MTDFIRKRFLVKARKWHRPVQGQEITVGYIPAAALNLHHYKDYSMVTIYGARRFSRSFKLEPEILKALDVPHSSKFLYRIEIQNRQKARLIIENTEKQNKTDVSLDLSVSDAQQILEVYRDKLVKKTEYRLKYSNQNWSIHEYHGKLKGLVIAEALIPASLPALGKPVWLGRDVSKNLCYNEEKLWWTTPHRGKSRLKTSPQMPRP